MSKRDEITIQTPINAERFPALVHGLTATVMQIYGIFKKEFALQYSSRLAIANRLIVGPAISLVTTGILYQSVFVRRPALSLTGLTIENYLSFIIFGFLVHTILNAGYYVFSGKVLAEQSGQTLTLLCIAPCNKAILILGIYSTECFRCLAIAAIVVGVLFFTGNASLTGLVRVTPLMILLFAFSIALGLFRSGLALVAGSEKAEFINNFYIFFVFTSCPYIPSALLPGFLRPLCELNPAYHLTNAIRLAWDGQSVFQSLVPFVFGFALIWGLIFVGWSRFWPSIVEKSV